jgi:catechol 2,3-dioxygenase
MLGLHHTASYPKAYFFAANNYHHHVATNIWIGTNILPANNSNNKPGLDHYAVKLSYFKEKEIRELKNLLKNMGIDLIKQ